MYKNIRILRKNAGLSQQELANALNVHQTAVSQWETSRVRYKKPLVSAILSFFACFLGWISFEASNPLIFYIVLPIWNATLGGSIPSLIFGIQAIRRFYRDEKQFGKGSTTALVLGKCATIFSSMAIFLAGLAVAKFFGVV